MWRNRRTWAWMVLAILIVVLTLGTVAAAASGTQVLEDRKGDHPAPTSQLAVDTSSTSNPAESSGLSRLAKLKAWALSELHKLKTWWDDLPSIRHLDVAVAGSVLGTLLGVGAFSLPWRRRDDYGTDGVATSSVWPEPPPGSDNTGFPTTDQVAFLQWLFGVSEQGYGPLTKVAVAQLQRIHGIPVDSQVMIGVCANVKVHH